MRFFVITALAALAVATPVELEARQARPDPNSVYVESASSYPPSFPIRPTYTPIEVTWAGTGCPPGSVAYDIGESGTLVSLSFSKYVAATGTGQSASDARKASIPLPISI
jgi:hypothetical protein